MTNWKTDLKTLADKLRADQKNKKGFQSKFDQVRGYKKKLGFNDTGIPLTARAAKQLQKNRASYRSRYVGTTLQQINEERAAAKIEIARIYDSQIFGDDEKYQISLSDYVETRMLATGLKSRMCKYAEGYKPYRTFINEL